MAALYAAAIERWDWRLSARTRLISLGSVWVLIFFGSLLGPLLPLLGFARMVFGGAQMGLNQLLARHSPLNRRDRYDWMLLVLAFAGSITAASLAQVYGAMTPLFMLPLLIPYTVLQLRTFSRSIAAHRQVAPEPITFPSSRSATERIAA